MKQVFLLIGISLFLAPLASSAGNPFAPESVIHAIQKTPVLSLKTRGVNSYQLKYALQIEDVLLGIRVYAEKPDHYTFVLFDPSDGTPIMVGYDNKVMFYDPTNDEILLMDGHPLFQVKLEGRKPSKEDQSTRSLTVKFGFSDKANPDDPKVIDLPSLLDFGHTKNVVKRIKNGNYIVAAKDEKGYLTIAYVEDAANRPRLRGVGLYSPDQKSPMLSFTDIQWNEKIPRMLLSFPDKKLRASGLKIHHVDKEESASYFGMAKLYKAILARFVVSTGIVDMGKANEFEKLFKTAVDWKRIKARDKEVSTKLKSIFIF